MRIDKIHQTPFITKENTNLLWFDMQDWSGGNAYRVTVIADGKAWIRDREVFHHTVRLFVPLVESDTPCRILFREFDDVPGIFDFTLHPVKKWTIQFLASSHEDLGYCEYANRLASSCADYLDIAMNIMDRDSRFKYLIEHDWWLKGYEQYRSEEGKKRLKEYFRQGNIELSAAPCSVHTHWHGEEQLLRSMYFGCRESAKEWGITPTTVLYADISGASWSAVSAYRQAGIRYIPVLRNSGFRISSDDVPLPKLFWWIAPNGRDRLLCWTQNGYRERLLHHVICDTLRQYPEGTFYFDESKARKMETAVGQLVEEVGDAAYDMLPVGFYDDHESPTSMLLTVCDTMNERWAWPHFEMGLPGQSLRYIEEKFGDTLPELQGDMTDQWADFAAIAPLWFAKKREAQRLLPVAELLTTLRSAEGGLQEYPQELFRQAYWRLCEFDDHCWASGIKQPLPLHRYNLYSVKWESAHIAAEIAEQQIGKVTGIPDEKAIAVWNTLPRRRKVSLRLNENVLLPPGILVQRNADGGCISGPVDLPPCGYRVFRGEKAEPVPTQNLSGVEVIDMPFYHITCSVTMCKIIGILDKKTGEELIDRQAPYGLGDFIYLYAENKNLPQHHCDTAIPVDFRIERGPHAVIITKTAYERQVCAEVCCKFIFYEKERNIDVELSFQNATGLMGDFYDRYKKNIFFAFPFRVTSPRFFTELALGVVDEEKDRLPAYPRDFVVANNWVAVQNEKTGIALLSRDMPVFHLGGIHYNQLKHNIVYESSSVYLYAASNRCNQLNYLAPGDCQGHFRLSILPYQGDWQNHVPVWAEEKLSPPLLGKAEKEAAEKSYLSVDCDHARLLCVKKAEDCLDTWVFHFAETRGQAARVALRLPFEPKKAVYASTLEEPYNKEAAISGTTVIFEIGAFSYVTLRITGNGNVFLPDNNLNVEDAEDVFHIFSYDVEGDRQLVGFEKKSPCEASAYDVYIDGKRIRTVKNEPYKVQFFLMPRIKYNRLMMKPCRNVTGGKADE